jgi:DNA-binding response OmpR family regulator
MCKFYPGRADRLYNLAEREFMSKHILLVDDDALLRRSLAFHLEQAGYTTGTASSAEDALEMARQNPFDLVILDIGLPGMDGLDALKQFQAQFGLPVIFLTARRRELDEVVGMEMGADDYITKPFDPDVLLAHVKAVLRRTAAPPSIVAKPEPVAVGDLNIDPASHQVTIGGDLVELTPREFDLLYALALNVGQVLSVDDLLTRIWGAEFVGQPQVVYVHIRWLREKVESDPNHPTRIVTVRGVGYRLELRTDV